LAAYTPQAASAVTDVTCPEETYGRELGRYLLVIGLRCLVIKAFEEGDKDLLQKCSTEDPESVAEEALRYGDENFVGYLLMEGFLHTAQRITLERAHGRTSAPPVCPSSPAVACTAPAKVFDNEHPADPPGRFMDHIISYDFIHNPVMTPNGDTYDREVIERWIAKDSRCPITRNRITKSDLRPDLVLQEQIRRWKATNAIVTTLRASYLRFVSTLGHPNGTKNLGNV
jgi:hypothetical protein